TIVGGASLSFPEEGGFPGTLVEQIHELLPDVVIAEFEGQTPVVIENLLALLSEGEETFAPSIVILTDEYQSLLTNDAVRAGLRAALPRASTGDQIIAAVEAASAGLFVLRPDSMDSFLQFTQPRGSAETAVSASKVDALTEREIEVLGMLAEGLGNKT